MLNNVPEAINRMARNIVVNHPNAYNCQVMRKTVLRTPSGTMGGLAVLKSEDEENYTYEWLRNGYAMQAEAFAQAPMMDRMDANNGSGDEFRFLIVPETENAFEINKNDVFYLLLGTDPGSIKLAFEIVSIDTMVNIAPYTPVYLCNRRDDLHDIV